MTQDNHWLKELEKESLKEPKLKNKFFWLKPLTVYHTLEFRGLDKRDAYTPQKYDEWDKLVWNVPVANKDVCEEYYIDLLQCIHYTNSKFNFLKRGDSRYKQKYCWKPADNYHKCVHDYAHHNKHKLAPGSHLPH